MVDRQTILERLAAVSAIDRPLPASFFNLESNIAGDLTTIASTQLDRPVFLKAGGADRIRAAIVVYEEFTNSTGASDATTYSLAEGIVDSLATAENLVLYQGNTRVAADSIDYDNDTFTYTDDGSGDPLHAYYASDQQAELVFKKVAPSNVEQRLGTFDAGRSNIREQDRSPLTFQFDDPLDGVVPHKWDIRVQLNAPYSFQWADDTHGDAQATNAVIRLPARQGRSKVPDLDRFIRRHAAER